MLGYDFLLSFVRHFGNKKLAGPYISCKCLSGFMTLTTQVIFFVQWQFVWTFVVKSKPLSLKYLLQTLKQIYTLNIY